MFELLSEHGYGELHFKRDAATGLEAIVAIHDVRLGPALGGCRFIEYPNGEAACIDALRLARGMTYKAAITGIPHGGGKSVIIKPQGEFDRQALFGAFGAFVDDLGGRYITAEDSGTRVEDMHAIRRSTMHVTGLELAHGGSGDPSPFTALGVRRGIEACVAFQLEKDALAGLHVAVQGVGNVGYHLCKELTAKGVRLTVADIDGEKVSRVADEFGATVAPLDAILSTDCDVLAPCALGGALNDSTIPDLQCQIVAGAANNQLAESRHGEALRERGILYAPDYAINAGGLVNVAQEVEGYDAAVSRSRTMGIYDTIMTIVTRAASEGLPTHAVARAMAEERLQAASAG